MVGMRSGVGLTRRAATLLAIVVAGSCGATALVAPLQAGATFPGKNGMLVVALSSGTRDVLEGVPSGSSTAHTLLSCSGDGDSCPLGIYHPRVSPNGQEVAFDGPIYTDSYTTNYQLGVYSLLTHKVTLVPFLTSYGGDDDTAPGWLPGSDSLVLSASGNLTPDGNEGTWLYSETTAGKDQKQLRSCDCSQAAVSPNGRTILFDRGGDIWRMNADGGDPKMIVRDGSDPSWGPRGVRFAYLCGSTGHSLCVASANGSAPKTLVSAASNPTFSPEGDSVAYSVLRGRSLKIYAVAATGGRSYLRFTQTLSGATSFGGFDWQPTGG